MNAYSPIFIHSLFRAGSTYIFNTFRKSTAGYCCYQEALHEIAFYARTERDCLLGNFYEAEMQLNRHPIMDAPYFFELHRVWDTWNCAIEESAVYNAYFAAPTADLGTKYWKALISASQSRPVFQECRTSGRIAEIKRQLDGHHLFLWRNPWDQWWSSKVTPYFDMVNQLIINSPSSPRAVQMLLRDLALDSYEGVDISGSFEFYGDHPLSSENSFLIFYTLWCLSLREGALHADVLINIDRLCDSESYRKKTCQNLARAGIEGVGFDDCHVPQSTYTEKEKVFFLKLENQVHQWLIEGGWSEAELDQILEKRQEFEPMIRGYPEGKLEISSLLEQASRARALAVRFETTLAEKTVDLNIEKAELDSRITQIQEVAAQAVQISQDSLVQLANAENRANAAEEEHKNTLVQLANAENRANAAEEENKNTLVQLATSEQKLAQISAELHAVHQANHSHWQSSEAHKLKIEAMTASASWKLTAPLRWLARPFANRSQNARKPRPRLTARLIKWGMKQPQLVKTMHYFVDFVPPLRRAITHRVALVTEQNLAAEQSVEVLHPEENLNVNLTPYVKNIYLEIKSNVEEIKRGM